MAPNNTVKADLRNIPVVGWGMRQFEFLFLDRNWQADKRRVYRCVRLKRLLGWHALLMTSIDCHPSTPPHTQTRSPPLTQNQNPTAPPPNRLLGSFVEDGYEACLLIFPEGTTVNTRTFDKSRAFAAGKQRPELNHLVLPRCVEWIVWCGVGDCVAARSMDTGKCI